MKRVSAIAAGLAMVAAGAAAAPTVLVPNRAIYDVSLDKTSAGGIITAHGRVVIEFRDVCDGWTTTQRMVADLSDADGRVSRTDYLVNSWESKIGREMRFDITNSADGQLLERLRGDAKIGEDGSGDVSLAEPKPLDFLLPAGTQFPTGQILDVLKAAEEGRSSLKGIVFQGGDKSDVYLSTVLIGKKGAATPSEAALDKSGLLKNVAEWPVLVSFFPNTAQSETPDYEIASRLFANGIIGSMSMIYSKYTLKATLIGLEPVPPNC
jgi:hypothetical protein